MRRLRRGHVRPSSSVRQCSPDLSIHNPGSVGKESPETPITPGVNDNVRGNTPPHSFGKGPGSGSVSKIYGTIDYLPRFSMPPRSPANPVSCRQTFANFRRSRPIKLVFSGCSGFGIACAFYSQIIHAIDHVLGPGAFIFILGANDVFETCNSKNRTVYYVGVPSLVTCHQMAFRQSSVAVAAGPC